MKYRVVQWGTGNIGRSMRQEKAHANVLRRRSPLMDRFVTLSAVIVSLLAVSLAMPAGAVEKCKAKVDKKTGAIGYDFKYGGEGSVGVSYLNHGLPSTHTEDQEVFPFANEESCQQRGRGKACQVSSIPDVAAIAPTNCKAYLYDESDDTVCEVRVPGCQPALRPLPTSGYFCIENNHETTAVWDAATGHAWHISSDHQPRSLDDHHAHLLHLNGDHVDPEDTDHTPLVDGADLELPTLHPLKQLAGDCAALFDEVGGVGGTPSSAQECLHTLCTELWPDPASPDNWRVVGDARCHPARNARPRRMSQRHDSTGHARQRSGDDKQYFTISWFYTRQTSIDRSYCRRSSTSSVDDGPASIIRFSESCLPSRYEQRAELNGSCGTPRPGGPFLDGGAAAIF